MKILNVINKVIYFTSEIRLAYELIEMHTEDKDFMYRKLYYLYVIRYKDLFSNLENQIEEILIHIHKDYEFNVAELMIEIQYLNENLSDVNKYKK